MVTRFFLFSILSLWLGEAALRAQKFHLPTGNRSIFKLNEQEQYFVGTVGRPWISGTFGCVRSGGWQMHEGIDVRAVQKDKSGEPLDNILATASGKVAYINSRPALSNYGNYIVLQHIIDGLEVYSSYAHLSEIRRGLKVGQTVARGEVIGQMGRTTNTRERISKERAHLHFEVNFFVTERFSSWLKKKDPKARNDHGLWNGQNLIGVDPQKLLLLSHRQGADFNFLSWVQNQDELCRVLVRKTNFTWLKRYSPLVAKNPVAEKQGIAGYEISLNYNGLPFRIVPRAASEIASKATYQLLSVNAAEYRRAPCRRLVEPQGKSWKLASSGVKLLELLTH